MRRARPSGDAHQHYAAGAGLDVARECQSNEDSKSCPIKTLDYRASILLSVGTGAQPQCYKGPAVLPPRVVLITGANGGLGGAVTNAFLQAGARVAGVARKIQNSDFSHPNFTAYAAELGSADAARAVAAAVISKWGK